MEAVATENDVSPADKPDETSVNRRKLEKLDADISGILKTMVKSDERDKQLSSEIISAGVQMLAIRESNFDAWEQFKRADKQAKEIFCKGDKAEYREVATVLWRRHRAEVLRAANASACTGRRSGSQRNCIARKGCRSRRTCSRRS